MPDIKETELESSKQEAVASAYKNSRIVLVSCCAWKCVPTAILVVYIYLRSLGVVYFCGCVLSESQKNYCKDWCLMNSLLTLLFSMYF